jgi:PII-like signaling protein
VYICEQDHWHRQPLYLAILELVRAQGGAGATVLKGVAGYSAAGRTIHTGNLVDVVPNLPVMILVVDTAPRIAAL